jgi:hypothetical protein
VGGCIAARRRWDKPQDARRRKNFRFLQNGRHPPID